MNDEFAKAAEQAAAFQKIWMDSFSHFMRGLTANAATTSPDALRQTRSSIFQSLASSWDEYLRSPQFLEGMRQWMDSTITFRKLTNEWMARARNEFQAPSREDVDTIMLNVRHMEQRLLDRIEQLSKRIESLNGHSNGPATAPEQASQGRPLKNRRRAPAKKKVQSK